MPVELSVDHVISHAADATVCVVRCLSGVAAPGTRFAIRDTAHPATLRLDRIDQYGRQVVRLDPVHHAKIHLSGPGARDVRAGAHLASTGPASFTDTANWSGGCYELSIQLGDSDDDRLQRALAALWRAAPIDGCHASRDREPWEQEELPRTVSSLAGHGHLRGTVLLPTGDRVVCGCFAIREDDGPDWLGFYLPLGALARADRRIGGFPFDRRSGTDSLTWRRPLDDWLAALATRVHAETAIRLALIGFETPGDTAACQLNCTAPAERWEGYLLPAPTRHGLRYFPANR